MHAASRRGGFSMLEVAVAVGILGVLAALTLPRMDRWRTDLRTKEAVRSLADLMVVARAEAVRTQQNHAVFFWLDAQGNPLLDAAGNRVAALMIRDANADGIVDPGETVATVPADPNLGWGAPLAAGTGPAPNDPDPNGAFAASGFTFVRPDVTPAQWVVFLPDGVPRAFSIGPFATGAIGSGVGGVYVTNNTRDYAVVLAPLGAVRVHPFDVSQNLWRN